VLRESWRVHHWVREDGKIDRRLEYWIHTERDVIEVYVASARGVIGSARAETTHDLPAMTVRLGRWTFSDGSRNPDDLPRIRFALHDSDLTLRLTLDPFGGPAFWLLKDDDLVEDQLGALEFLRRLRPLGRFARGPARRV